MLFRHTMEEIGFAAFDPFTKKYIQTLINKEDLDKFPKSLFSLIITTSSTYKTQFDNELQAFIVSIEPKMLKHIAYFYKMKCWKNPHLRENNLSVIELNQITDYLNLPDNIEEVEDPEEEYAEDEEDDIYDYYANIYESDEELDPSLRDDHFDDDHYIDYDYDPNSERYM